MLVQIIRRKSPKRPSLARRAKLTSPKFKTQRTADRELTAEIHKQVSKQLSSLKSKLITLEKGNEIRKEMGLSPIILSNNSTN